jgi:hypothetical protein
MEYAREAAVGQPVVSLGLELHVENADGLLEIHFEGSVGSTLAFTSDGSGFGDLPDVGNTSQNELCRVNALTDSGPTAQAPLHGNDVALQDMIRRIVTRGIKVQMTKPANRNARTQTAYVLVSSASVRTKAKRIESTGV